MAEYEKIKNPVHYCPLCGHQSIKDFEHEDECGYGGEWICEQCDERVEAFLLLREGDRIFEEDQEDRFNEKKGMSVSVPIILILMIIVIGYYFFMA